MTVLDARRRHVKRVPGIPPWVWSVRDELRDLAAGQRSEGILSNDGSAIDSVADYVSSDDSTIFAILVGLLSRRRDVDNEDLLARLGSAWDIEPRVAKSRTASAANARLDHIATWINDHQGWRFAPYILEGLRHHGVLAGDTWSAKRRLGIFYTPPDLAQFVVSTVLDALRPSPTRLACLLDPACGSGAFLVAGYHELIQRGVPEDDAFDFLAGMDVSTTAVLTCTFALLLQASAKTDLRRPWSQLRRQLKVADLRDLTGGLWGSRPQLDEARPLGVVANPPYVEWAEQREGGRSVYRALVDAVVDQRLRPEAACLVLPMSVGVDRSMEMGSLRRQLAATGQWKLAFFDRSPDSLFGDAVKTRHVVASYRRSPEPRLETTALMRWSSSGRHALFSTIRYTDLTGMDVSRGIPKLGSEVERALFERLRMTGYQLGMARDIRSDAGRSRYAVHVGDTAYNWIPTYLTLPEHGSRVNARWVVEAHSHEDAAALLALLASDLVYWFWLVWGDAFHVPASFLRELPLDIGRFSMRTYVLLSEAGTKYWACAVRSPNIKRNAGVDVARFQFDRCLGELAAANAALADELGYGPDVGALLAARRRTAKAAGRSLVQ